MIGNDLREQVRGVVLSQGRLASNATALSATTDLYQAGLSSHAAVHLMLALEDHFDIEFPERMLQRKVFESIAAIASAVDELLAARQLQP